MKRIYESIPVQSILYIINPYTKLKIIDDHLNDGKPVVVYEGIELDRNRTFYCKGISALKVEKAKVRGLIPSDNGLEIHIDTRYEEF